MQTNCEKPVDCDLLQDVLIRPLDGAVLVSARIDQEAYTPGLYGLFDIDQPANIAAAVDKRAAEFLAGRLVIRAAAAHLGLAPFQLPIGPDRAPVWPSSLTGSISHTRGLCAGMLSQQGKLCGVDREHRATGTALEAIRCKCLVPDDTRWLAQQTDQAPGTYETLIFSAKETVFKALTGIVGGFFGFDCAKIVDRVEAGVLRMALTKTLHRALPEGFEIDVGYEIGPGDVMTWIVADPPPVA